MNEQTRHGLVLDRWESFVDADASFSILPDGCRDLIVKTDQTSQQPYWFISPYFHTAKTVNLSAGSSSKGYRLMAGATIDSAKLLNLTSNSFSDDCVENFIEECVFISDNLREVLAYISVCPKPVNSVAKELGVSTRTLQRLVEKQTGLTPSHWIRLSRIRTAGRCIALGHPFIEVAAASGFADQSHLTRECVHWFGLSPTQLLRRTDLKEQLFVTAYS